MLKIFGSDLESLAEAQKNQLESRHIALEGSPDGLGVDLNLMAVGFSSLFKLAPLDSVCLVIRQIEKAFPILD